MPEHPEESPLVPLWRREYPFQYWDNRIKKINQYNPQDRLEALFVALQLSDLYTHIFATRATNPAQPWFILKEGMRSWDIGNVLDVLTEDTEWGEHIFTEKLAEGQDELIQWEKTHDDWDVSLQDWVAIDLLGCPAEFDEKDQTVNPLESTDIHYGGANAILSFWRENRALLNDFKHGFRILPVTPETFEFLVEEELLNPSADLQELMDQMENHYQSGEWVQHIARMETEKGPDEAWYDYEVNIHIHKVNAEACVVLAELTLKQLFNLFSLGGSELIEDKLAELLSHSEADESDVVRLIEPMGQFQITYAPAEE